MAKILISKKHGSVYWLTDEGLAHAPLNAEETVINTLKDANIIDPKLVEASDKKDYQKIIITLMNA